MATLKYSNRGGIPCIKSTSAVVIDTTLTVTFPTFTNAPRNFSGVMAVNIAQPFTATGVTTINFVMGSDTIQLMASASSVATATQVAGAGVYLVFYDNAAKTMQIV